jgi:hypothetical protein
MANEALKFVQKQAVSDFLNRLSPHVQEAIRKDMIWKIRCFINYQSIEKEKEGTTERTNDSWASW